MPYRGYDDQFYLDQIQGSQRSARAFIRHLKEVLSFTSVVDVGCGRGAWLHACSEIGADKLYGVDGPWIQQSKLIRNDINFHPYDFNSLVNPKNAPFYGQPFDLAISVEFAEHVSPNNANNLIDYITSLSDCIIFGAATVSQDGYKHVNEQPQSYWAEKLVRHNYAVFDLFRPAVWGAKDVEWWYQQNTFLYAKKNSHSYQKLKEYGAVMVKNLDFLNCIHPELYHRELSQLKGFRNSIALKMAIKAKRFIDLTLTRNKNT